MGRELEGPVMADQVPSLDDVRVKPELRSRLANTKALMGRHIAGSRRLLRTLLEEPLQCEAVNDGEEKRYRITGTGSYLPLLPETHLSRFLKLVDQAEQHARERNNLLHALWTTDNGVPMHYSPRWDNHKKALEWRGGRMTNQNLLAFAKELFRLILTLRPPERSGRDLP